MQDVYSQDLRISDFFISVTLGGFSPVFRSEIPYIKEFIEFVPEVKQHKIQTEHIKCHALIFAVF